MAMNWIYLAHNRPIDRFCEQGRESFGSLKNGEFLDALREL
jgi:hypothetical protein